MKLPRAIGILRQHARELEAAIERLERTVERAKLYGSRFIATSCEEDLDRTRDAYSQCLEAANILEKMES